MQHKIIWNWKYNQDLQKSDALQVPSSPFMPSSQFYPLTRCHVEMPNLKVCLALVCRELVWQLRRLISPPFSNKCLAARRTVALRGASTLIHTWRFGSGPIIWIFRTLWSVRRWCAPMPNRVPYLCLFAPSLFSISSPRTSRIFYLKEVVSCER